MKSMLMPPGQQVGTAMVAGFAHDAPLILSLEEVSVGQQVGTALVTGFAHDAPLIPQPRKS